ncbi:MAG: helicase [Candidatus Anammoximicrobium sp.]|nr:helicase [Candidatus Anammoximicrobium sp.]
MALTPADILGPAGLIARRLSNYEHRVQQMELADAVAEALRKGRHLVAEAGTGVGKSFAYLVPAILAVAAAQEEKDSPGGGEVQGSKPLKKIVVSTHTISLQEQLLYKDLPLLTAVLPLEFTAVLVKGRRNYVSLRRLETALGRAGSLFNTEEELDQLRALRDWAKGTTDGSLSDLTFKPAGAVWDEVASDNSNCLGKKCPRYKDCFYYQARRRVFNAQILIVNHALFFSDLALRRAGGSVLPKYDAVIFDEAHTLEAVAADHLGVSVSSGQVQYILNKLYNDRTNKGLLVHLHCGKEQRQTLHCSQLADDFFRDIHNWLQEQTEKNGRVHTPGIVGNSLSPALIGLAAMLRQRSDDVEDEAQRLEFVSACERLITLANELEVWRTHAIPEAVYWIEATQSRRGRPQIRLEAAPIDIGSVLRQELFEPIHSVIMTSATLAVGRQGSFEFFRSRVGLTKADTIRLGSPFNYHQQVKLILVDDMPDPTQDRKQFDARCIALIRRYIARTDGRAFVLFTSYDMMRLAASQLTAWLSEQNLALYSQADGLPRHEMLERFKADPRSVLFGADSFWQGVDVPGEALQNVIITKLPFSVPDQPLLQARLEAIRCRGGNPFMDYQVPEAAIRLKQGFGRLIRTQQDRGIVVLLDPRVRTKRYGQILLESLPPCEVIVESAYDTQASDA